MLSSLSPSSESTYVYRGESDNQSRDALGAEAVGIIRLFVDVWLSNLDQLDAVLRLVLTHVEKFAHPESGGVDTAQALLKHLESMNRVPLTVPTDGGSSSSSAPADNLRKFFETVGTEVFGGDSAGAQTGPNAFAMWGSKTDDSGSKSAVLKLMEGSLDVSNVEGVAAPQISLGELRRVGKEQGWTENKDGGRYFTPLSPAPFGVSDARFKALGTRKKATYLMLSLIHI